MSMPGGWPSPLPRGTGENEEAEVMDQTLGKVSVSRFFFPCLESMFPSCSILGHNGYHPTYAIKCLAFSEFEQFTPISQQRVEVIQWKCNNVFPTLLYTYFGVLEIESKQFEQERNQSVWLRKMSFPAFSWTLLSFGLCLPPIDHLVLKAHMSVTDNFEVHLVSSYWCCAGETGYRALCLLLARAFQPCVNQHENARLTGKLSETIRKLHFQKGLVVQGDNYCEP